MFAYHCSLKFWWASRGKRFYKLKPANIWHLPVTNDFQCFVSVYWYFCQIRICVGTHFFTTLHLFSLALSSFFPSRLVSDLETLLTAGSGRRSVTSPASWWVVCLHTGVFDRHTEPLMTGGLRCFPSAGCMSGGLGDKGSCEKKKMYTSILSAIPEDTKKTDGIVGQEGDLVKQNLCTSRDEGLS